MPKKKASQKKSMKNKKTEKEEKKVVGKPKNEVSELDKLENNISEISAKLDDSVKPDKTAASLETDEEKKIIETMFARERIITESSDEARNLYSKSVYGHIAEDGKVQLSLLEALYLLEKKKISIKDGKKKIVKSEDFIKRARKVEPNFWIRYCVFKDMRNRGYVVKTALKFGADFRVYDRGIKPGEDHAKWVVFPVHEGETLTWYEFAAKNRVAHSTKKRLLMGIVDDEGDVTYYEIKWVRP